MNEKNFLTRRFEENRPRLRSIAYRMLGSTSEADDAVQEAWLRLSRSDMGDVANLGGWLTTVVGRICLDMLRARTSRREDPLDAEGDEPAAPREAGIEQDMMLADSVSLALLVVLEKLGPAERVAFVLHDMFDLPFEEVASILGRTPDATRQLASRARRRVRGGETVPADRARQREVLHAFLAASKGGDMAALLAVLDPDVVFRADPVAARMGAPAELRGAEAVANLFKGRAQAAQPALVDGGMGVLVVLGGKLRIALRLFFANGRISMVESIANPEQLRQLDLTVLDG
jgi:RNA polymerase sigma-70 factor (ECF subfamily)